MLDSTKYQIPSGNHVNNPLMKHLTGLPADAAVCSYCTDEDIAAVDHDGQAWIYFHGKAYLIDQIEFQSPLHMMMIYGGLNSKYRALFREQLLRGDFEPKKPDGAVFQ